MLRGFLEPCIHVSHATTPTDLDFHGLTKNKTHPAPVRNFAFEKIEAANHIVWIWFPLFIYWDRVSSTREKSALQSSAVGLCWVTFSLAALARGERSSPGFHPHISAVDRTSDQLRKYFSERLYKSPATDSHWKWWNLRIQPWHINAKLSCIYKHFRGGLVFLQALNHGTLQTQWEPLKIDHARSVISQMFQGVSTQGSRQVCLSRYPYFWNLAHRNRGDFCDLRLRCPSRTPEIARFPRQEKAMLHCDLRVRWKVASDLRFRAAISEPKTPSFCGISGDLAQSTRKSLAIAIVRFWCAKFWI